MKYAIADYLTDEEKERALSVEYPIRQAAGLPCPATPNGNCPLGMALGYFRPPAEKIAWRYPQGNLTIEFHAQKFIDAWDGGLITDLAAALGVAR